MRKISKPHLTYLTPIMLPVLQLYMTCNSELVYDDIAAMRSKLVYELKRDESVTSVWTIDGKILCIQEESGREMKKVIDSPDDLFKDGWTNEKVAGLSFYSTP